MSPRFRLAAEDKMMTRMTSDGSTDESSQGLKRAVAPSLKI
jgi:hypothetical protein